MGSMFVSDRSTNFENGTTANVEHSDIVLFPPGHRAGGDLARIARE